MHLVHSSLLRLQECVYAMFWCVIVLLLLLCAGKPISKCGKCGRYMKYIPSRPSRIYCPTCEEVYALPQVGTVHCAVRHVCQVIYVCCVCYVCHVHHVSHIYCPTCEEVYALPQVRILGCYVVV
jgi:hypothetical protein